MGKKIVLSEIAHARSGDKGDTCNIGVIALEPANYVILKKYLTAELVKEYFKGICLGEVRRYEMPNVHALNFVLDRALGGGGTTSLRTDTQGKTLAAALLQLELPL